jgi:two-component system, NarL family, response regulator NreC
MTKIRIVIADDHAILRAGLAQLFKTQSDMEVLGEASDGHEAIAKVCECKSDVLVLDLVMPGLSGVQVIERLRKESPQNRVLVFTMHDEAAFMRSVLAAGGAGYVVKTAPEAELLAAIRAVASGRLFIDSSLSGSLVQAVAANAMDDGKVVSDGLEKLSEREREIFALLAEGQTNRAAAEKLFLSVKTVETYRARIRSKLNLQSRADFVRFAAEIGLLGPSSVVPNKSAS